MFSAAKTAAPSGGYTINNSLRFRSSASAYLNRTFTSSAGATTWTWSGWVKRGSLGVNSYLLEGYSNATNRTPLLFTSSDTFQMYYDSGGSVIWQIVTNQVFRDPSAWYHIVLAYDSTQATAANRVKLYVNGSQVTSFSTATYPTLNQATQINTAISHYIGAEISTPAYFDGYMAEVNFIDGQALTPSSFGSTNSTTGVWQPAKYTGTYGTNGFYLKFSNIALTSGSNTGLGQDFSGNGNYWNTNNISVTAGTTYDAMTDVPTLTSATVANYAVLNPLDRHTYGVFTPNAGSDGIATISAGNLSATAPSVDGSAFSSIWITSGKWYCEVTLTTQSANNGGVGLDGLNSSNSGNNYLYRPNALAYNNGTSKSYGATYTTGDVIGIAYDADGGTLTYYKNGTSQGTAYTGIAGTYRFWVYANIGNVWNANFGQQPFAYSIPSGFVALNTYNLPTSTIIKGNTVMDATLYTGTGATATITNASGFKPDLVWVKSRSAATDHKLTDSVRGVTKALISDTTGAETTDTNGLTAFNSNGWSLGTDSNYNNNTATYVGWQWQAGQGSSSSNTNGSITSTVSVNTTAGFSVVTYTGNGVNPATIGHGLGVAPKMIIVKNRTNTVAGNGNWPVYHVSTGNTNYTLLNTTAASTAGALFWGNTTPTSTVFTVGNTGTVNDSGFNYVAYCWAAIPGFSAFGSYTGNGSTDGPFVFTNFQPKYIMVKKTTTGSGNSHWWILDTTRKPYNANNLGLQADLSNAETSSGTVFFDFLSNGFKLRSTDAEVNDNGQPYIYAAFSSNPFKNSNAF